MLKRHRRLRAHRRILRAHQVFKLLRRRVVGRLLLAALLCRGRRRHLRVGSVAPPRQRRFLLASFTTSRGPPPASAPAQRSAGSLAGAVVVSLFFFFRLHLAAVNHCQTWGSHSCSFSNPFQSSITADWMADPIPSSALQSHSNAARLSRIAPCPRSASRRVGQRLVRVSASPRIIPSANTRLPAQLQLRRARNFPATAPSASLRARRRYRPVQFQLPQMPVYVPARANPLHNLLPQVAALAEVKRPHLRGLLRQVALRHVNPVRRNPLGNPKRLQRRRSNPVCARRRAATSKASQVPAAGIQNS